MKQSFTLDQFETRRDWARWGASSAVVVAVHAALAAVLVATWLDRPASLGEVPAVLIDLAPPPAAPPAPPVESPPQVAEPDAQAPLPIPDPTPPPEIAPDAPPPMAEAVLSPEPPEPAAILVPSPVEAPPIPAKKDAAVLPPKPKKIATAPRREPDKRPPERKPPRPVQADRQGELRETRRPAANASGAQTTASLPSLSVGNSAASKASWQSQLVSYLQRSLRYPPGSGNGGSAAVSFSMDRGGRVLSARVTRSAGSPDLDAAALATFRGTLPAAPPDVPGSTFAFTIPVRFNKSF